MKWFLKNTLIIAGLAVLIFSAFSLMYSDNTTFAMIGVAFTFLLILGLSILIIVLMAHEIFALTPRPVRTQLLDYATEGIDRMASAGLGSLFGGNLGMAAGFIAGGKKDVATFLVTYSNGKERIESVKLNSLKYRQYLALQK